jgi:nitroimidazol reductase NimA-like FMN-containing flavoprotein (pyridoxamine 5'-phosphate oxidase superfamily)
MTRRALEDLSSDECFTLLGQETVGRLIYMDDLGPAAVPLNYALAGRGIVFRSEDGSKIRALREHDVAFEVDHIDKASRSGWSVLVRGTSEEVEFEHLHELLVRIDGYVPLPWKKGIHKIWVVITPKTVTGRRLADFAFENFF